MARQDFKENIRLALSTLVSHKLRSFLTTLGVIIGTATVIAIASIIAGLNTQVVTKLESYGTNTAFVFKFTPGIHIGNLSREERMRKPLQFEDAMAIKNNCPAVENVSAEIFARGPHNAKYGANEVNGTNFSGTIPSYERTMNAVVSEGRFFSESENEHHAQVCLIGSNIQESLFPQSDPIDKEILVHGRKFRVIGLLEKRKGGFFGENNEDKTVIIPYETFKKIFPAAKDHFIAIQAKSGRLQEAIDQATQSLRRTRKVPFNAPDNFGISTAETIIEQFHSITGAVAIVMVVISSIGLLVGGVGVMNIMLVSVTERTKEIGVRKAIGARKRDIIWQFLFEAMALTALGGVIGIGLGSIISVIIRKLTDSLPTEVPLWAVVLGVIVSTSVGLIFGMWPAIKAARLDPIEALRYE